MRKIISLFLAGPMLFSLAALAQHVTLSCIGPCGGTGAGPNCGYSFYRSADGGSTWTLLNATPTTACNYVDSSLSYNGQTYDYYAMTIDPSYANPDSAHSNTTVAAMPMPDAAAAFDNTLPAGTIIAPGVIIFTWANNPGVNVQSYDLILEEQQGQTWATLCDYQWGCGGLIPAGTTHAALTIPQNGDMVNINLRTNFIDGTSGTQTVFYRETAPAGIPQLLSPLQYSAPCSSNGNVTFAWSNGPSDTTTYYLHAGTSPGGWDVVNWNVGLVNSFTIPLLNQGPRIVWVSIQAHSPTKGDVYSDQYADAYVACHAIN